MTLKKLESYGGFDAINGDVHRQPASIIGHPCLVRHLGFTEVQSRDEADRARAVSGYLQALRSRMDELVCDYDASQFERVIDDSSRGRVVLIDFAWRGLAISLRIEIHTENIALTTFIDLSLRRDHSE